MELNHPSQLEPIADKITHMEMDGFFRVLYWLDKDLTKEFIEYWVHDHAFEILEIDMKKRDNKS